MALRLAPASRMLAWGAFLDGWKACVGSCPPIKGRHSPKSFGSTDDPRSQTVPSGQNGTSGLPAKPGHSFRCPESATALSACRARVSPF